MLVTSSHFQSRIQDARLWWSRTWPGADGPGAATGDEPLRAELFSADQMAQHGKRLAATHELSAEPRPDRLLARLASNERVLVDLGKQLATTADAERRFTPAAEWLLDNFYLIEEQIRTARRHLPRGYSRELPRLRSSRRTRRRRAAARLRPRAAGDRARRRPRSGAAR